MEIGVETVSFVHSLAPARQTLSKGTTSPQIFRPFTPGLEKATVISVRPTVWVTDPLGLGRGRSSFVADCASATLAERMTTARTTRWMRRCTGLPPGEVRGPRSIANNPAPSSLTDVIAARGCHAGHDV